MDNENKSTESTETIDDQVEDTDVETPDENNTEETGEKKYTDDDVDEIIKKRLSRAQKKFEKEQQEKVDEAKKLAKMNADQKQQYEMEKIQKEAAEARAELATYKMRDTASSIFKEQGITANDEALDLVTTSEADSTKTNVSKLVKFAELIKEETTKELTKGTTPRVTGKAQTITRDEIMQIVDPVERQQKIAENMSLFPEYK